MWAEVQELRDRVDRLAADPAEGPTLFDRLRVRDGAHPPECPELLHLDRDLRAAGVHTAADARLLGGLARADRRAHHFAEGLGRRGLRACAELSRQIDFLEREKRLAGSFRQSRIDAAEDLLGRLARAAVVVSALSTQAADGSGIPTPSWLPPPAPRTPPDSARLAVVEHFLREAQGNALDVRRKRRFLDLAHEMLRDVGSGLGDDRTRSHQLRFRVAEERKNLKELDALVRPGESLTTALRRAVGSGAGGPAWRALLSVHRSSLDSGHAALADQSRATLERLWGSLAEKPEEAWSRDPQRQAASHMGNGALREAWQARGSPVNADPLVEAAYGLFPEQWSLFDLALTAAGFFDVDAAEEDPEEPEAPEPAEPLRRVPYPTPQMSIDVTSSVEQLRDFIIADPRLVLFDVASGKQLVRAWAERTGSKPSRTRKSRVRVYVCDASGSMRGARARFRDAVLIAELNNLSLRARSRKEVWPVYFSFFNDRPQPLQRVDSDGSASSAISRLIESSPARGRTDITFALEMAFQAIHEARGLDPDLARATVVLITDGEDRVDLARIDRARRPVGDIEITLNFISLGHENEDLRALTLQQKDRGRRAFYTHLSEEELSLGTGLAGSVRTLLPHHPLLALTPNDPAVLAALDALEKAANQEAVAEAQSPQERFDVYFPLSRPPPSDAATAGAAPPADARRVEDLVGAVAEALALVEAQDRAAEAVRLVEHLLQLYAVEVAAFQRTLLGSPEAQRRGLHIRRLAGYPLEQPEEARGAQAVVP